MSEYKLIPATDTRLNLVSSVVVQSEIRGKRVANIIAAMIDTAMGERDEEHPNLPTLVGLAAPQIGAFVRIILFDKAANPGKPNFTPNLEIIINPVITQASSEQELGREGCYSTADVTAAIYRSTEVKLSGHNQNGEDVTHSLTGFQARIVQHEVDHLNGIRCPDRIRSLQHLHRVKPEEFQDYRENWQTWTKLYPIEDWLKMKRGEAI